MHRLRFPTHPGGMPADPPGGVVARHRRAAVRIAQKTGQRHLQPAFFVALLQRICTQSEPTVEFAFGECVYVAAKGVAGRNDPHPAIGLKNDNTRRRRLPRSGRHRRFGERCGSQRYLLLPTGGSGRCGGPIGKGNAVQGQWTRPVRGYRGDFVRIIPARRRCRMARCLQFYGLTVVAFAGGESASWSRYLHFDLQDVVEKGRDATGALGQDLRYCSKNASTTAGSGSETTPNLSFLSISMS